MKFKLSLAILAAVVGISVATSTNTSAQEYQSESYFNSGAVVAAQCDTASDWYVSGFGAYIAPNEANFSLDTAGPDIGDSAFDLDLESESGYGVGAALGRRFRKNFRLEGEFVYRNQSLDNLVEDAGELASGLLFDPEDVSDVVDGISSRVNTFTLATNLYYDFNLNSRITPYVGFGTGVQFVGFRATSSDFDADVQVNYPTVIYQWMAGISSPLNKRSDVFVEYRGLGTFGTTASASVGPDSISVATSLYQSSVFAGFRRNF